MATTTWHQEACNWNRWALLWMIQTQASIKTYRTCFRLLLLNVELQQKWVEGVERWPPSELGRVLQSNYVASTITLPQLRFDVLVWMASWGNIIWHQSQLVASSNPIMNDLARKKIISLKVHQLDSTWDGVLSSTRLHPKGNDEKYSCRLY